MADYSDALESITQEILDNCATFNGIETDGPVAYLTVSPFDGVAVRLGAPFDSDGNVPLQVHTNCVLRFMLQRGVSLMALRDGLSGGTIADLLDDIADGHQLTMSPSGVTGELSPLAEVARDQLLEEVFEIPVAPVSNVVTSFAFLSLTANHRAAA
jgi:hypothetical protein